jgi:pimeloyl-ACP methyl ester carboxylesterase
VTIERISWDGFEARVDDSGEGARGPAVFLHSSGMSGDQWRRTAEAARKAGYRTVVPDFIGSGRSPAWPDGKPFHFDRDVELVSRMLDAIGQPARLVGHSYGGFIALQAALRDPARVSGLVLYDPVAFGVLDSMADTDARADLAAVNLRWGESVAAHEAWLEGFVDFWGGPNAWSRLREEARAEFRRVGFIVFEEVRTLMSDATAASVYRAALRVPTLVVGGELSPIPAKRVVARLAEAIERAEVATLAGAGHMGPLTHGGKFTALCVEALSAT